MTNPRTAAATSAASRKAQERRAEWLRARGWTCVPPELAHIGSTSRANGDGHNIVRMEFAHRDAVGGGCE